jgi:hypothetical protein
MIKISKAPFFVENVTGRQTPGKGIFTHLCSPGSAKTFVARAARELSQYYIWLQRTDKPWC